LTGLVGFLAGFSNGFRWPSLLLAVCGLIIRLVIGHCHQRGPQHPVAESISAAQHCGHDRL
jgi:hypothetical protein